MIKGCKHYFTLFGMLIMSINSLLSKFFSQMFQQNKKYIPIHIMLETTQLEHKLHKNQTYQG